jgi:hypothetical protein
MTLSQIEFRDEAIRATSRSGLLSVQRGVGRGSRGTASRSEAGLFGALLEITLCWGCALVCLVAALIWLL